MSLRAKIKKQFSDCYYRDFNYTPMYRIRESDTLVIEVGIDDDTYSVLYKNRIEVHIIVEKIYIKYDTRYYNFLKFAELNFGTIEDFDNKAVCTINLLWDASFCKDLNIRSSMADLIESKGR